MFENIGGKIQKYAKITTWIGIIGSCLLGLFMVISAITSGDSTAGVFAGLGYMVFGALFSWVGNFFTYAFGMLAEQSELQTGLLYQMLNTEVTPVNNAPNGTNDTIPTWMRVQMEQSNQNPQ